MHIMVISQQDNKQQVYNTNNSKIKSHRNRPCLYFGFYYAYIVYTAIPNINC